MVGMEREFHGDVSEHIGGFTKVFLTAHRVSVHAFWQLWSLARLDVKSIGSHDFRELWLVISGDQTPRFTRSPNSAGSTNAVDEGIHVVWNVIVDDQRDPVNVDSTGSNVRGDDGFDFTFFE